MDKAKVEKWMNRLARATKTLVNTGDFEDGVLEVCMGGHTDGVPSMPCVQLHKGLHDVAEMFGLEETMYQEDEQYKWYSIIWNDVKFIQLDSKED